MIAFRVLGEIGLSDPERGPHDNLLRLPKRVAVLAYLALPAPGAWHRRDTLLALFWPEHDQDHARSALRNALYVLRQHLGEGVIINRGDEELAVDPAVLRTDFADLRAAIARGDHADALTRYAGELLPGLYAIAAPGFEHWLEAERERLRSQVTEAGRALASGLERKGDLDAAIQAMRRVLEIDGQDERSVRLLMTLHERAGDRAGGLHVFESYRSLLQREFAAHPSAESVAVAERLRLAATPGVIAPAIAVTAPASTPTSMAGGSAEHQPPSRHRRAFLTAGLVLTSAAALTVWRIATGERLPVIGASSPVTAESGLQVEPAISPDARLVAYAAGDMLRLRITVTRLAGGVPWPVAPDTVGSQRVPRWAPDNDAILFLGGNSAYAAHAVGGDLRLVAQGGENETSVRSASWSPDGDSIAVVRGDSLVVIPRDGPGFRLVGTGRQIHTCAWSPMGTWIACVAGNWLALMPGPLFGNRGQSAIVLFPAKGGQPLDLTGNRYDHRSPAWSADGRMLWMLSDRGGSGTEAYVAPITTRGRLAAEWRRVGLAAEFLSIGPDRIAYSVPSRRANVFSLSADTDRVQAITAARAETRGTQIIEVVRCSPDGAWLLYDSNIAGNSDIYRVPIAGGRAERLTSDPREEFAPDQSPDGRFVAYHRWEGGARRLKVLDLGSGAILLPDTLPGDQAVPRWSPDGTSLVYWDHGSEPGSIVMLRQADGGRWRRKWHIADAQLPVWSPDGHWLAFVLADGGVRRVRADSAVTEVLYAPRQGTDDPIITYLAADPRRPLLWMLGHRPGGGSGLWAMRDDSGPLRHVADFADPAGRENGPSLTTDGKRLYFTLDEHLSNIRWATLSAR